MGEKNLITLHFRCPEGSLFITRTPNSFFFKLAFKQAYRAAWAILEAFVPLIIMTFCNTRLIIEVSRSKARYSMERAKYTTSRITIILIAIIVLHAVLVCPSLIISFFIDFFANRADKSEYYKYLTAMVITNVMQTINFAINFILYCIISKTFRENLKGRTCNLSKIHSNLRMTPKTSSEEAKHKYQLADMTTNQTVSTRATPTPSSRKNSNGNGTCLA